MKNFKFLMTLILITSSIKCNDYYSCMAKCIGPEVTSAGEMMAEYMRASKSTGEAVAEKLGWADTMSERNRRCELYCKKIHPPQQAK